MELKIAFTIKQPHEKYGSTVQIMFTEEDLKEWVKQYVEDNYLGEHEVLTAYVESVDL